MVPMVPAFGGVPGGPELLILLVVLVLLFGVPLVVIAGVVLFFRTRSDGADADADRIAELEAEVERLREKVDDEPAESDGDDRG
ncbi:preprotein translocase subunit TatA [Halorubrum sp. E3]|uniref:Preprotein translocase subunit TatA n=1 Tax=Halorubrum persicum TaxID=1383844 RepID=A0A2G1WNH1_9EURY|nr:preprotein translocase subunit TatA [Halorubrum persicum]OYR54256.1 preprotein translocase subunit TatA [Halorubrum sp. E3]PHQ40554.1 preprotein translocase subunit TatA [Halorubrum persicum]